VLISVDDVALGHETKLRWNDSGDWVWSGAVVHEPLVSVEDFERAQAMFSAKKRATRRTPKEGRQYVLAGLVHCLPCKRMMQGQWNHGRAYYRCRYPLDYPVDEHEHPRSIYVREAAITQGLDPWLASLFDDDRIDETCEILAGASEPDPDAEDHETSLRREIADVDRRLEGYRAVLDQGGDPAVVARWISDAQRERRSSSRSSASPFPAGS
jgi:site-specific DNA recombinase